MTPLLPKEPNRLFVTLYQTCLLLISGVVCSRRICNVQTQGKSLAPLKDSAGVEVSSNFAANVWEVIYRCS